MSREFLNEQDQRDLDAAVLQKNKFMSGLLTRYGLDALQNAALQAVGYPASMVATHQEAAKVATYLSGDQ